MGIEIERKFLVDTTKWKAADAGTRIVQAYLCSAKERTVRVRLVGEEARLTIKGEARGISRSEYEYPIPTNDAHEMLERLCERPFIEKTRHLVDHAGRTWEVDVFHGDNEGLVVAEVELDEADAKVELPPWTGKEVSEDHRYSNSSLAKRPWPIWKE
ncbi:MAG: CYTH domain-containing protein [Rectinemataceae bacterium]|jgi:adenylate cyclase